MSRKSYFFIITWSLIFISIGCKFKEDTCSIEGKWYFHQVNRNYRPTNTLAGGYFEFLPSNRFKSNIFDEGNEYSYDFNGESIVIATDEELKFNVVECKKDTLIMAGEISAFYMNFLMTRSPQVAQPEMDSTADEDDLQ